MYMPASPWIRRDHPSPRRSILPLWMSVGLPAHHPYAEERSLWDQASGAARRELYGPSAYRNHTHGRNAPVPAVETAPMAPWLHRQKNSCPQRAESHTPCREYENKADGHHSTQRRCAARGATRQACCRSAPTAVARPSGSLRRATPVVYQLRVCRIAQSQPFPHSLWVLASARR